MANYRKSARNLKGEKMEIVKRLEGYRCACDSEVVVVKRKNKFFTTCACKWHPTESGFPCVWGPRRETVVEAEMAWVEHMPTTFVRDKDRLKEHFTKCLCLACNRILVRCGCGQMHSLKVFKVGKLFCVTGLANCWMGPKSSTRLGATILWNLAMSYDKEQN